MSFVFQPRRPRASPLWQIVHHGWADFHADYEQHHRKSLGPLRTGTINTVQSFLRCGDLAAGFTCFQCPDCGRERLLAFTSKGRHFCPACHQLRTQTIGAWIADSLCHEVPHRQFVFTIPKVLRGIFRKLANLLSWKHPGFNIDNGGEQPVPAHDADGRKRLAEYLLRHPFSPQKITWNATTKTVIYRSKRHQPPSVTSRYSKPPTSSPPPPFGIETMEPVEPPWQAIKEWIPDDEPNLTWFNQERKPVGDDSRQYDQ